MTFRPPAREAPRPRDDRASVPEYGVAYTHPPFNPAGMMSTEPPDQSVAAGTASAFTFLAGVWLLVSPFALVADVPPWNNVVVGIVIAVLALVRAVSPREVPWLSVVNAVLGVWLIISPFALPVEMDGGATANNIVIGVVVILAAGASAALSYRKRVTEEPRERTEAADGRRETP